MIEISYRSTRGIATRIWLITSGGVIIAATIKDKRKAYFLLPLNIDAFTIPAEARPLATTGRLKTKPKATIKTKRKLR